MRVFFLTVLGRLIFGVVLVAFRRFCVGPPTRTQLCETGRIQ